MEGLPKEHTPWRPDRNPPHRYTLRPQDLFLPLAVAGLLAGAFAHLMGATAAGHDIWAVTTAIGLIPATGWVIAAIRSHRLGADVIAVLALAGTLAVGETLAGAVIAVMLASGRARNRGPREERDASCGSCWIGLPASRTDCQATPQRT